MSGRLPVLSGEELARVLEDNGWSRVRQKGSHLVLKAPGRPTAVIPMHKQLDRGTLAGILRQLDLDPGVLRPNE